MNESNPEPNLTEKPAAKPRKRKSLPLWLAIPTALYVSFLALLTFVNLNGPDQWSLGSFNLYVPQWLYALPALLLLPLFLWRARRWLWLPLLCGLWTLGPIMGFCWRWTMPAADETKGTRLRVMTYNVKIGRWDMSAIAADIEKYRPDIVLFQEANGPFRAAPNIMFAGWNVQAIDQFMIASRRFPLHPAEPKWISFANYTVQAMRCEAEVNGQTVTLYTAHLKSPRGGLLAMIRNLRHPNQADEDHFLWNTDLRRGQAKILSDYLSAEKTPTLLTGDLNAPVQSLVCRQFFNAGMRDAFSEAGRGYGYSYGQKVRRMPFAYVRIDHILMSKEWKALDCQVGNTEGSEHRPVIADLYLSR